MSERVLLILSVAVLTAGGLSGCFGSDDKASAKNSVNGADLPPFETTLYVHNLMFHPHPEGMLSAWVFSEDPTPSDAMTFDPPVFRVKEGQTVRITLTNTHPMNHTIHWHGMHVPWEMDGVPYVTQDPVQQNEHFIYEFVAKPSGTFWFHCHVDAPHHVDMGMYGVLIVEPNEPKYTYDRDYTLVFDDWDSRHIHQQDNDPQMTADSLQDPSGDPFNQGDRLISGGRELVNDPRYAYVQDYYENPLRAEREWYPETFAPWMPVYDTFTINGRSYPFTVEDENTLLTLDEGETIKVRLVNVGNTMMAIHLHGHHFKVTHSDGYPLDSPLMKDTLMIGPGERYDILIEGNNPGIWMLHDHVGTHEMNNHISPGGIMTKMVYSEYMDMLDGHGGGHHKRSTDFFGLYR